MVTRWGMSDRLGMVQLASRQNPYLGSALPGEKPFSEDTARLIDAEVRGIIKESHESATRLLTQYRRQLDMLVEALARDTLDEKEILEVTGLPAAAMAK
jgi:cell division protease FtsH